MLYNPDLYKEPSLRDCLDFVRTKNPTEAYHYPDSKRCACAQYSHAKGMTGAEWNLLESKDPHGIWSELNRLASDGIPSEKLGFFRRKPRWTFGAFAERLEKELQKC